MSSTNRNKHLTHEERKIIETGIFNGSTKAAIAETLGKDASTIGKEIQEHRFICHHSSIPNDCKAYSHCKDIDWSTVSCPSNCPNYVEFTCTRRDRSPGACNGCSNNPKCRHLKYKYSADRAEKEYRETLVDSRAGVNLTTEEAKELAEIVGPLLKKGQSPYMIITNHPELGICEKTLYNYIESGVFETEYMGRLGPLDLRRQASRKLPKHKQQEFKKRQDRKYLKGRLYSDFKLWKEENPFLSYAEMDTVYNNVTSGPFIQTFTLKTTGLIVGFYHDSKTVDNMIAGINLLEESVGRNLFEKYFGVLLTDRGSEFVCPERAEFREDGSRRTRVFYCDPMRSGQKGSLEEKHVSLRYICPKHVDLRKIGLTGQEPLNLALSHINSAPLEMLNHKSALEYIQFMYPDLYDKLSSMGIKKVDKDQVTLKPYLLKNPK